MTSSQAVLDSSSPAGLNNGEPPDGGGSGIDSINERALVNGDNSRSDSKAYVEKDGDAFSSLGPSIAALLTAGVRGGSSTSSLSSYGSSPTLLSPADSLNNTDLGVGPRQYYVSDNSSVGFIPGSRTSSAGMDGYFETPNSYPGAQIGYGAASTSSASNTWSADHGRAKTYAPLSSFGSGQAVSPQNINSGAVGGTPQPGLTFQRDHQRATTSLPVMPILPPTSTLLPTYSWIGHGLANSTTTSFHRHSQSLVLPGPTAMNTGIPGFTLSPLTKNPSTYFSYSNPSAPQSSHVAAASGSNSGYQNNSTTLIPSIGGSMGSPSVLNTGQLPAPLNASRLSSFAYRIPLQDRPFKCDECVQSFNRNHDLKRHKRIHLAVKPYPCGWCDKSFSRKDALKRHLLVKGCGQTQSSDRKDQNGAKKKVSSEEGHSAPSPPGTSRIGSGSQGFSAHSDSSPASSSESPKLENTADPPKSLDKHSELTGPSGITPALRSNISNDLMAFSSLTTKSELSPVLSGSMSPPAHLYARRSSTSSLPLPRYHPYGTSPPVSSGRRSPSSLASSSSSLYSLPPPSHRHNHSNPSAYGQSLPSSSMMLGAPSMASEPTLRPIQHLDSTFQAHYDSQYPMGQYQARPYASPGYCDTPDLQARLGQANILQETLAQRRSTP